MVIFRRKNICGISTENYVLCSFELEKDPTLRICAIRIDLRVKSYIINSEIASETSVKKHWNSVKYFNWTITDSIKVSEKWRK
jgi:hypothetical protein